MQKPEKKCKTAITFTYDVEKMRLIYQKKLEKKGVRFHPGLPGQHFTDSSNSKIKKVISNRRFLSTKSKKIQKVKNSKSPKKSYNKEDC